MKKLIFTVCCLAMALFSSSLTYADQVIYEPGPSDGMDVWLSSYYDYGDDYGVDDWKLQAGGWGDEYRFLIKFDITDLPSSPTSAVMWMVPYDRGDSSDLVGMYMDRVTSSWDEDTGWYDQPSATNITTLSAPSLGYWYGITITSTYNNWKNATYTNYGLKFRPVSTNNDFSQFYSSDLSSTYRWARPKLVVTYDGANLGFPLDGYTPYNAPISGVVDHYVTTGFNNKDGSVVTFEDELGNVNYDCKYWISGSSFGDCDSSNYTNYDVVGYENQSYSDFLSGVNYHGGVPNEDKKFIFYDGHTGYDYPADNGTDVYSAAAGYAVPYGDGGDAIKITHPSGYDTYYLHLSTVLIGTGQSVLKGAHIGDVGSGHLHFTVKKSDGTRVDPYGWKGEWGTDPLQIDNKDNVCLWDDCQWW